MNKLTVLDSFVDRIGQEVKVDDIVLYPRIVGKSPELTVAKVISIKQSKTNLVVRIRCIKSEW